MFLAYFLNTLNIFIPYSSYPTRYLYDSSDNSFNQNHSIQGGPDAKETSFYTLLVLAPCLLLFPSSYSKNITDIQKGITDTVLECMQTKDLTTYIITQDDFERYYTDAKTLKWYADITIIEALRDTSVRYIESIHFSADLEKIKWVFVM